MFLFVNNSGPLFPFIAWLMASYLVKQYPIILLELLGRICVEVIDSCCHGFLEGASIK